MWTAINVAASGVRAQNHALDVTANNLANLNTTAFKSFRVGLVDAPPVDSVFGAAIGAGGVIIRTQDAGQGAALAPSLPNFSQGPLEWTGRPLDVAIAGQGFLAVTRPNGSTAYTRDGALRLDGARRLVTASGAVVTPTIAIPETANFIEIRPDGTVLAGGIADRSVVGRLSLTRFNNPDGLQGIGGSLYVASPTSGEPITGYPGTDGLGQVQQRQLEESNVDPAEEMLRALQTLRAYQLNARALQMISEMVAETNSLATA